MAKINRNRSVTEYPDADLVKRAVRAARPYRAAPAPRWVAVMDTFALGSSFAWELCKLHGFDPEEVVPGIDCPTCDDQAD